MLIDNILFAYLFETFRVYCLMECLFGIYNWSLCHHLAVYSKNNFFNALSWPQYLLNVHAVMVKNGEEEILLWLYCWNWANSLLSLFTARKQHMWMDMTHDDSCWLKKEEWNLMFHADSFFWYWYLFFKKQIANLRLPLFFSKIWNFARFFFCLFTNIVDF
jgi:hypothetical protein